MTGRRGLVLGALLLVLAAVIALLVPATRTAPPEPTELVPDAWQAARKTSMHVVHMTKGKVACAQCHGGEPLDLTGDGGAPDAGGALAEAGSQPGFVARPGEGTCTGCHEKASAQAHVGSAESRTTCLTCHVFRGGAVAAPCASCHAGDGARKVGTKPITHHATGGATCETCHDLHGAKQARAFAADCTVCHAAMSVRHGSQAVNARVPVAGDAVKATFEVDAGVARAARKDAAHGAGPTCATCHAPHTPGGHAKDACVTCHAGTSTAPLPANVAVPRVVPRGPKVASHEACTTCHAPHDARKDAVRACADCHQDKRGAAEVTKAHAACTTCHAPHAPSAAMSAAGACASCHADHAALGATKVSAHAACTSCHAPHDPKAKPAAACASCHAGVHPQHPAATAKGGPSACTGCHAPHPGAKATKLFAAGAAPVTGPGPTGAVRCASCHDALPGRKSGHGTHGKGVACASCHEPHAFRLASGGAAGAAVCAKCHAPVAKTVAASTTAAKAGHAACASCHGDAHAPVRSPACASCHKDEAASAKAGHAACASCHEPHGGAFTAKGASCTNCHAEKATALHANVPNGCASCHRPHGGARVSGPASPPACATCHQPAKLPGLHGVAAHAKDCASCHGPHAPPRSDRATCTTGCHTDRRAHQPDAAVCKGCHLFKR